MGSKSLQTRKIIELIELFRHDVFGLSNKSEWRHESGKSINAVESDGQHITWALAKQKHSTMKLSRSFLKLCQVSLTSDETFVRSSSKLFTRNKPH